ncbi:uncharacterized protein LOC127283294 isoform X1 [Leptopilina boulardi]|uniref:uncharacterized protein LOC127283294 isoform X1 n=1 Tax=Leptopilina boulardi TaxID=63433 RepID=UPI0021F5E3DA|nr:uncharacterized protein LOC127283294 isoform X1 [Leptopilina boulardi]
MNSLFLIEEEEEEEEEKKKKKIQVGFSLKRMNRTSQFRRLWLHRHWVKGEQNRREIIREDWCPTRLFLSSKHLSVTQECKVNYIHIISRYSNRHEIFSLRIYSDRHMKNAEATLIWRK